MNDNLNNVTILPPFKKFCMTIGELPTSYVESMTYYESLVWLCNYLGKTVIPALNANGEAVIELQEKYIELKDYVDNYFKNLDIQEEINNKLDDMAESGQLADIIAQYLEVSSVLGFDTKADLKGAANLVNGSITRTLGESSYNDKKGNYYRIRTLEEGDVIDDVNLLALSEYPTLVAELVLENVDTFYDTVADMTSDTTITSGNIVKTLGYYAINDGGAGLYLVRNKTVADIVDNGSLIAIGSTLVAELIETEIKLEQFGCVGDGTTNDTTQFTACINYAKAKDYKVTSSKDKVYLISSTIDISNISIDLNNAYIKAGGVIDLLEINEEDSTKYTFVSNINFDMNNVGTSAIKITKGRRNKFYNINIINVKSYGIKVLGGYENLFNNINLQNVIGTPNSGTIGLLIETGDCHYENITMTNISTGFYVKQSNNFFNKCHVWLANDSLMNEGVMFLVEMPTIVSPIFIDECYCDTMRYFIKFNNNTYSLIHVSNLLYSFNESYYKQYHENTYVIYGNIDDQARYVNFSNCDMRGLSYGSGATSYMTNRTTYFGKQTACNISGITYNDRDFEFTSTSSGLSLTVNKVKKNNDTNIVNITVVGNYDSSTSSSDINFNLGNIGWDLLPREAITSFSCMVGDTRWADTSATPCYMYIPSKSQSSEPVTIRVPHGTGTKYIFINMTYIV